MGRTRSGGGLGEAADEGAVGDVESVNQSMFMFAAAPPFLVEDWGRKRFLPRKG